jgi:predicted SAM-dependent methyltransferase
MWREIGDTDEELRAFAAKVAELNERGLPVKIYPGCGDTIAHGFINLDIEVHGNLTKNDPRWNVCDMFIFPFADMPWPLPDNSCDYIFHEDFFEHIMQKQQIGFLAETLRVLKPGGWHRINTPCLAASMKRHSRFAEGHKGVYFQEWEQHGHVSLVTRGIIDEMAKLVGYREVFFTMKNQASSPHRYGEGRPGPDRDQVSGNVFADLIK